MVTAMDVLKQHLADLLHQRDRLVAQRKAHADAMAASMVAQVNERIAELDRAIEATCRDAIGMTP
jgi:hypothetical protein